MNVHEALAIDGGARREAAGEAILDQTHQDARLVPVAVRVNDAGTIGLLLEQRADRRVGLGIERNEMTAVTDASECRRGAVLDGARAFDENIDRRDLGCEFDIGRDERPAFPDRRGEAERIVGDDDTACLEASGAKRGYGPLDVARHNQRGRHPRHSGELVNQPAPHQPDADDADPDRIAPFVQTL